MFTLDDRLSTDTVEIARWTLCRVLLMNDRTYPWLILVPQREGVSEIHELSAADRLRLMEESSCAAQRLQLFTAADKMNVAALGNIVRQLHIHVIARFDDDPAWPGRCGVCANENLTQPRNCPMWWPAYVTPSRHQRPTRPRQPPRKAATKPYDGLKRAARARCIDTKPP